METKITCSECGSMVEEQEAVYVHDIVLCPECAERTTVTCRSCGDRIWMHDATDGNLCAYCYENYYLICNGCGDVIHSDDAYYSEDDEDCRDYPYCESCYHKYAEKMIHDYYYKPEPNFFGEDRLYMGVELEIDEGGENEDSAGEIYYIANRTADHMYMKHDGSLDNGFELVSHPMTLNYHKGKMPWRDILRKAINLDYRSHQAETCGLHIHVNKNTFGNTQAEQEDVIARLVFFYEKFWAEILRFSRRTESQANHWASRYGGAVSTCKDSLDTAKKAGLGRYTAVNLMNHMTVEFRIFRGTLRYETFIATLEFTHYLCSEAMMLNDEQFQAMSWDDFVRGIKENDYSELIEYLKRRRLYINEQTVTEG